MPIHVPSEAAPNAFQPPPPLFNVANCNDARALRHELARQSLKNLCDHTLPGLFARLIESPSVVASLEQLLQWHQRLAAVAPHANDHQHIDVVAPWALGDFLDAILLSQVTGSTEDAHVVDFIERLKQRHRVPRRPATQASSSSSCGFLFQRHDTAFTCATCRVKDMGDLLCYECFRNGNHQGHHVREVQVDAGSTCDCGDPESYTRQGCCLRHRFQPVATVATAAATMGNHCPPAPQQQQQHDNNDDDDDDDQRFLPSELLSVASILFRELVDFMLQVARQSVDSFDLEQLERAFFNAQLLGQNHVFHVRLFDDAVHTSQQFLEMLEIHGLDQPHAIVDRLEAKQHAMVCCTTDFSEAASLLEGISEAKFRVSLVNEQQLRHETVLIHVVRWLRKVCEHSGALRKVLIHQLFVDTTSSSRVAPQSPLGLLFLADPAFPREISDELYGLYARFQAYAPSIQPFSLIFAHNLPAQLNKMLPPAQGFAATGSHALFRQFNQFVRKKSIAVRVMNLRPVVDDLVTFLQKAFQSSSRHNPRGLPRHALASSVQRDYQVLDPDCDFIQFRLYHRPTQLLTILLANADIARDKLLLQPDTLGNWLDALRLLQGMNLHLRIRESQAHMEFDPRTYVHVVNLRVCVAIISVMAMRGLNKHYHCSLQTRDDEHHHHTGMAPSVQTFMLHFWRSLRRFLDTIAMDLDLAAVATRWCCSGLVSPIVQYDVLTQPVSLHYPLHHQFGLFVLELLYGHPDSFHDATDWKEFFYQTAIASGDTNPDALGWCLLEFPLRALVLAAQVQGGLWVRNAKLEREVELYKKSFKASMAFQEIDLLLVQFCALVVGLEKFLSALLDRCGFLPWLLEPTTTCEQDNDNNDADADAAAAAVAAVRKDQMVSLVQESLLVLIWLVTEIPMRGHALTHHDAWVRRDVVHRLASEPQTFQQLLSGVECVLSSHVVAPFTPVAPPTTCIRSPDVVNTLRLEKILQQVARMVLPKQSMRHDALEDLAPTKYELSTEAWRHEYDPAYCRLERTKAYKAENRRNDVLFRGWSTDDPPIPLVAQLPNAHGSFARVRLVLLETGLLGLLRVLLEDTTRAIPCKTSTLVIMRVLHLLNLVVLVLQQEKGDDTISDAERQRVVTLLRSRREAFEETLDEPSRKRFRRNHADHDAASQGSGDAVDSQSIVALLVTFVNNQMAAGGAKSSISVVLWILKELASMDPLVDTFVRNGLRRSQHTTSGALKQKMCQQRALEAIQARQKAFCEAHGADLAVEDANEQTKKSNVQDVLQTCRPSPGCSICLRTEATSPVMYIGHVQTSQLSAHALYGKPCSNTDPGPTRPQLQLHLCGHTVHLSCWREYVQVINARHNNVTQLDQSVFAAFDSRLGEFLCPYCNVLSSLLVPYVEPHDRTCLEREIDVIRVERGTTSVTEWLSCGLRDRLASPVLPTAGVSSQSFRGGMAQFGRSYQNALRRVSNDSNHLEKGAHQVHWIWSSIASTLYLAQLSDMSMAISGYECSVLQASSGQQQRPNPQTASLESRLALNLPQEFESYLGTCFTVKDERNMACVLRALRLVPLLFDSTESFGAAVCAPLSENLQFQLSESTWSRAHKHGAPLVLGLPILSQDLMYLLVIVCGLLESSADRWRTIRSFCVLHMAQVLLQCSCLKQEEPDMAAQHDESTSLEQLMQFLQESSGFTTLRNTCAPSGKQLQLLFETSCLVFLRQVTLLCRSMFCDHEHQEKDKDKDKDKACCLASHLRLSTNYHVLRQQLGVPTVQEILQDNDLMRYLQRASLQLQTNPSTSCGLSATTLLTNNAAWMPPLPIRQERQVVVPGAGFYFANVRFIPLPDLLIDLVHQHRASRCPTTGKRRLEPTLCLMCGQLLCAGSECCGKNGIGASTLHAQTCEDGVGVFLVLWNDKPCIQTDPGCKIVVIAGARYAVYPSPYMDQFGGVEATGMLMRLQPKRLLPLLKLLTSHRVAQKVSARRALHHGWPRNNYY